MISEPFQGKITGSDMRVDAPIRVYEYSGGMVRGPSSMYGSTKIK